LNLLRLLSLIIYSLRLSQLTAEFQEAFPHPAIPPLPRILATVSTSMSKQTDNHFFASGVRSKEFIPMYHDVILWMLKRDIIVTLHLRIRLVATIDLKARVKDERNRKMMRDFARRDHRSNPRSTSHDDSTVNVEELSPNTLSKNATFFLSPKTGRRFARSRDSDRSDISALDFRGADEAEEDTFESEVYSNSEPDEEDSTEDHVGPSMIDDPGKATPMQRRWLSAMSEGKAFAIARRFEKYSCFSKIGAIGSDCHVLIRINQYFDGKKSDDEIVYRAEISRKQLREVLHHYEEYVGIFRITDALGSIANFQRSCKYSYIHRKSTDFLPLAQSEIYNF
jgi:nitrogen permease regulator 3-like protein